MMMLLSRLKLLDSRLDHFITLQSLIPADNTTEAEIIVDEMKMERGSAVKIADCVSAVSSYLINDIRIDVVVDGDATKETFVNKGVQSIIQHIKAARFECIFLIGLTFNGTNGDLSGFVRRMVIQIRDKSGISDCGFMDYGDDKYSITQSTIPRIAIFMLEEEESHGTTVNFRLGFKYIYDSAVKVFEIHMNRRIDKNFWFDIMLYIERVLGLVDVVDNDRRDPVNRSIDFACLLHSITNLYIPSFDRVKFDRSCSSSNSVQIIKSLDESEVLSVDGCDDRHKTLTGIFWMSILGLYLQIKPIESLLTSEEIQHHKKSIEEYLASKNIGNSFNVVHMFASYDGHDITYVISILQSDSGSYSIFCLDSYKRDNILSPMSQVSETMNCPYRQYNYELSSETQCVNQYDPRFTPAEKAKCKQQNERRIIHIARDEICEKVRKQRAAERKPKQLQLKSPP